MLKYSGFCRLLGAMTCCVVAMVSFADSYQYQTLQWKSVPGSSYYEGTVQDGGSTARFRTKEHKLLFPIGSSVSVKAMTPSGLIKLDVQGGKEPEPVVVKAEPKQEEAELGDIPYKDDGDYKEDVSSYEDDGALLGFKREKGGSSDLERDRSGEWVTYLSIHQGLGQEKLSAKGGVSDFDAGSVNVAGPIFRATVRPPVAELPWLFETELGLHNFETTVREQTSLSNKPTEESKKYTRIFASLAAYRDLATFFGLDKNHFVGVGLGLGYYKLPIMDISDANTGAATLKLQSAYGPLIGFCYLYEMTPRQSAGGYLRLIPLSYGGVKSSSQSLALGGYWRYLFDEGFNLEAGLGFRSDKIEKDLTCPADIASCNSKSSAKSQLIQLRVGIGVMLYSHIYIWV